MIPSAAKLASFGNLTHSLRRLRQAPLFSTVVILTLAIGIGLNTAVFTIVSVLVRSLPGFETDRLVSLWEKNARPERNMVVDDRRSGGSRPNPSSTSSSSISGT